MSWADGTAQEGGQLERVGNGRDGPGLWKARKDAGQVEGPALEVLVVRKNAEVPDHG